MEKRLEDQALKLTTAARDLLRARILQRYRSMLEFDRAIGDPPGTVNQRVRKSATIRLKIEEMTRYLVFLDLDPGDFWSEVSEEVFGRRRNRTMEDRGALIIETLNAAANQAHEYIQLMERERRRGRR
jgi:hypothetical protein